MRITLAQMDITWEAKATNLEKVEAIAKKLSGETDLLILPEMFTTGFSMNSKNLAEETTGETIHKIKEWSHHYGMAICGSFIAKDNGKYLNRAFFIKDKKEHYYDKHHLFRMGEEPKHFDAGNQRLIVEHNGFRICLLVCYDLRFPVWSRNVNNEYDILVYVANWPSSRSFVWNTLLVARALENMAFVCGVNRVGTDGMNLQYSGNSMLIDARGKMVSNIQENQEQIETIEISKDELVRFREKFPVWKDADQFVIKN